MNVFTGKEIWRKVIESKTGTAGCLSQGKEGVYSMGNLFDPSNGEFASNKPQSINREKVKWSELSLSLVTLNGAVISGAMDLQEGSWMYGRLIRRKNLTTRKYENGDVSAMGHLLAADNKKALVVSIDDKFNMRVVGASQWIVSAKRKDFIPPSSLILTKNMVVAASATEDKKGTVGFFSPSDGSKQGSLSLPVIPAHNGLSTGGGRLYICGSDCTLFCYGE